MFFIVLYKSSEIEYNNIKYGSRDQIEEALIELEKIAENQLRQQAALQINGNIGMQENSNNVIQFQHDSQVQALPQALPQIQQPQALALQQEATQYLTQVSNSVQPSDLSAGYNQDQLMKLKETIINEAPLELKGTLEQYGISKEVIW